MKKISGDFFMFFVALSAFGCASLSTLKVDTAVEFEGNRFRVYYEKDCVILEFNDLRFRWCEEDKAPPCEGEEQVCKIKGEEDGF